MGIHCNGDSSNMISDLFSGMASPRDIIASWIGETCHLTELGGGESLFSQTLHYNHICFDPEIFNLKLNWTLIPLLSKMLVNSHIWKDFGQSQKILTNSMGFLITLKLLIDKLFVICLTCNPHLHNRFVFPSFPFPTSPQFKSYISLATLCFW